jgi:hypothetical protein
MREQKPTFLKLQILFHHFHASKDRKWVMKYWNQRHCVCSVPIEPEPKDPEEPKEPKLRRVETMPCCWREQVVQADWPMVATCQWRKSGSARPHRVQPHNLLKYVIIIHMRSICHKYLCMYIYKYVEIHMSQLHMSYLVASCHGYMCQPGCANAVENALPGHRGAEQHPSSPPKVFQRRGSRAPNDQLATECNEMRHSNKAKWCKVHFNEDFCHVEIVSRLAGDIRLLTQTTLPSLLS